MPGKLASDADILSLPGMLVRDLAGIKLLVPSILRKSRKPPVARAFRRALVTTTGCACVRSGH